MQLLGACLHQGTVQVWTWDEITCRVRITTESSPPSSQGIAWILRAANKPNSSWQEAMRGLDDKFEVASKQWIRIASTSSTTQETPHTTLLPLLQCHDATALPELFFPAHGVLMSCLQKAVRLCRAACALRIVYTIAAQTNDPKRRLLVELLRRLPIILIEDAVAHPRLTELVYLMLLVTRDRCALTSGQLYLVLTVVRDVCGARIPAERRCIGFPCKRESEVSTLAVVNAATAVPEEAEALDAECAFLVALAVRASWGGMNGDIDMLGKAFQCWRQRFDRKDSVVLPAYWRAWSEASNISDIAWPSALVSGSWWFGLEDRLPTAIDHHCSDILARTIRHFQDTPLPLDAAEVLQSLIWHRRSAVYRRICCCQPKTSNHSQAQVQPDDPRWWVRLVETGFLDRFAVRMWDDAMLRRELPRDTSHHRSTTTHSRKRILEQSLRDLAPPSPKSRKQEAPCKAGPLVRFLTPKQ